MSALPRAEEPNVAHLGLDRRPADHGIALDKRGLRTGLCRGERRADSGRPTAYDHDIVQLAGWRSKCRREAKLQCKDNGLHFTCNSLHLWISHNAPFGQRTRIEKPCIRAYSPSSLFSKE